MSAATKPINGNVRLSIATQADEELKRLKRERGEILTRLRKVSREIADLELIAAAVGVETVDVGSEVA